MPSSLSQVNPDEMDQLNNIFELIKADLALNPTEEVEKELQQMTLSDNLTSLLERVNVDDVETKVRNFIDNTEGLAKRVELGLSEFIN